YFNIDILRHPLHYKLVTMELERRNLHSVEHIPMRRSWDLRAWMERFRLMRKHRRLAFALLFALFFIITTANTFALHSPIWFFAVPLKFLGMQAAIVYFACAPVPPILAAGIGGRIGGRGWYGLAVLAGVACGMFLFNMTGTPSAIIKTVIERSGPGGGGF